MHSTELREIKFAEELKDLISKGIKIRTIRSNPKALGEHHFMKKDSSEWVKIDIYEVKKAKIRLVDGEIVYCTVNTRSSSGWNAEAELSIRSIEVPYLLKYINESENGEAIVYIHYFTLLKDK